MGQLCEGVIVYVENYLEGVNGVLWVFGVDLFMVDVIFDEVDFVYFYMWYINFVGLFVGVFYDVLYVISVYLLEFDCFWKVEQFGGGYRLLFWVEKIVYDVVDVVIVVFEGMRVDVLWVYFELDFDKVYVVCNGVNMDEFYFVIEIDVCCDIGMDFD